jgi:hypothetical protein
MDSFAEEGRAIELRSLAAEGDGGEVVGEWSALGPGDRGDCVVEEFGGGRAFCGEVAREFFGRETVAVFAGGAVKAIGIKENGVAWEDGGGGFLAVEDGRNADGRSQRGQGFGAAGDMTNEKGRVAGAGEADPRVAGADGHTGGRHEGFSLEHGVILVVGRFQDFPGF